MTAEGQRFWKMTGSGNDFVFFDSRLTPPGDLETASVIGAICDRRNGVGADGVVFVEQAPGHAFGIRYFNRDGSLAELCGNASLCAVTLAAELGVVRQGKEFEFLTSSGALSGVRTPDGPAIAMPTPSDLQPAFGAPLEAGETRIGFARVGVPHVVVLCSDIQGIDLMRRGRELRHHPSLPAGANANFVTLGPAGWAYRTYERGVEEETLACGSGSVAVASLLTRWGLADGPVTLRTWSGARLTIEPGASTPTLRGEGRLVFEGVLRDLLPAR